MRVRRPLTIQEILRWADAYRERMGRWPTAKSGGIVGTIGETWQGIDAALRRGSRSLPADSSLAQFLGKHRRAMSVP